MCFPGAGFSLGDPGPPRALGSASCPGMLCSRCWWEDSSLGLGVTVRWRRGQCSILSSCWHEGHDFQPKRPFFSHLCSHDQLLRGSRPSLETFLPNAQSCSFGGESTNVEVGCWGRWREEQDAYSQVFLSPFCKRGNQLEEVFNFLFLHSVLRKITKLSKAGMCISLCFF